MRIFLLALLPGLLCGQSTGGDPALARLKREMALARKQVEHDEKVGAARIAAVHSALRDWFEPQLPRDLNSLARESWHLEASLPTILLNAGLSKPESTADLEDAGFDQVRLGIKIMPELPDTMFVTAGISVPCGEDEAVYAYRFDAGGRKRIIDDHPKSDWGYAYSTLKLSDVDSDGRRLLLIHRMSTQCGSSWMGMTYAVYRISPSKAPESLLSSTHSFWLDMDIFILGPDQLMIELLDTGVDTERRTNILRYGFADGVKRLEPFAFQPQDFAEEWLTRPWSEMQTRSAPETQKWHAKLHADFVLGEYSNVVACAGKPDRWSIGLEIKYLGEKELKDPIEAHLLVRDLGNYRFEMEAVSDSEFEGCPGEGAPSDKHPWLSVEQLKALP
jgi:hypothetical protein